MIRLLATGLGLLALAPACGGPGTRAGVMIFAAASLKDAFVEVGDAFEAQRPDVSLTLHFAGSQQLARQILDGAPADVFASANPAPMRSLVEAALVLGHPEPFATNRLAIAVERGNPLAIRRLEDLAARRVLVVLGAPGVPIGDYARRSLRKAGVRIAPASLESDVRAVLSKVSLGEADAGIVYRSDLSGDRNVTGIEIADEWQVVASYPIARLRGPNPEGAGLFVRFVHDSSRAILTRHGFGVP